MPIRLQIKGKQESSGQADRGLAEGRTAVWQALIAELDMLNIRTLLVAVGVALAVLGFGFLNPATSQAGADSKGIADIVNPGNPGGEESDTWLGYLNWYRSLAGLPDLAENESFSYGCTLHAIYMVKNNVLQRPEDTTNEWYTDEGNASGLNSNVFVSNVFADSFKIAIDQWMEGPFTAVGILDPELATTGYGEHHENLPKQYTQSGAALDVISGLTGNDGPGPTPVFWPGNGSTTPIGIYEEGRDFPSPLASCPGYEGLEATGAALIIQTGFGRSDLPEVTETSVVNSKGVSLEHCVFDEGTYTNSNQELQDYGRAVLAFRDAIVIIPKLPLERGETYTVSITVNGQAYSWSFSVAQDAKIEP